MESSCFAPHFDLEQVASRSSTTPSTKNSPDIDAWVQHCRSICTGDARKILYIVNNAAADPVSRKLLWRFQRKYRIPKKIHVLFIHKNSFFVYSIQQQRSSSSFSSSPQSPARPPLGFFLHLNNVLTGQVTCILCLHDCPAADTHYFCLGCGVVTCTACDSLYYNKKAPTVTTTTAIKCPHCLVKDYHNDGAVWHGDHR